MPKSKPDITLDDSEVIAEGVKPDAAIRFWQQRAKLTWDETKDLADGAKARAFYVTALAQQDLVKLVSDGLEEALKSGETLSQFRERIKKAKKPRAGRNTALKRYSAPICRRPIPQAAISRCRPSKRPGPTGSIWP